MKFYIFIVTIFIVGCSSPKNEKLDYEYNELSIPLSENESFLSLSFSVGILENEPVIAIFNFINGDLKLSNLINGKELFIHNIPLEGPNSIPEHFLVNVHIGKEKILLISNAGRLIYAFDKKGKLLNTLKLPDIENDYTYFYFSDGNKLFFDVGSELFINYNSMLFPNRDPNKVYNSILGISLIENSFKFLAPLPKENIEKVWGEGHMVAGPFGIYSNNYKKFITGFSNSNVLKIYDLKGNMFREIKLELQNWRKSIPTNYKYEDAASLSQESIYELRAHSGQQQKVWKILEMKDGFLIEVLEPVSEAPLPRFSVHKFDLDFNYISTREFFEDHFTCYQSFVFEDKYHLVDLKAYQEDEDILTFGAFAFDDL